MSLDVACSTQLSVAKNIIQDRNVDSCVYFSEYVKILGASPEAFDIRLYELETKQASGN